MDYLVRNWTYVLFVGILFIVNTQLLNDVAWIWGGAETTLVEQAQAGTESGLTVDILRISNAANDLNTWGLRFPGLIMVVLAGLIFGWIGYRLFGWNLVLSAVLVWFGNLGLSTLAKIGSSDIWLFFGQTLILMGMLAFLKKPSALYRLITYVGILLATWLDPFSTIILVMVSSLGFVFFHPNGKSYFSLHPWAILGLAMLALWATESLHWSSETFYLGWGRSSWGQFSLWMVISQLPFLGFFVAGVWDSIQKARKKEEWSILQLVLLLAAWSAQSPAILIPISLLIGKHLNDYFLKNYPHGNIIKTVQLLHLVGFFFLATLLMLGGFWQYRGTGFRAGMAFSAVYWMLSFAGVIGLYGYNRRFVLAGLILSGVLATSIFWLQVFPILESQRISRVVIQQIDNIGTNRTDVFVDSSLIVTAPSLPLYIAKEGKKVVTDRKSENEPPEIIIGFPELDIHRMEKDTITGLSDQLSPVQLVLSYGALQ